MLEQIRKPMSLEDIRLKFNEIIDVLNKLESKHFSFNVNVTNGKAWITNGRTDEPDGLIHSFSDGGSKLITDCEIEIEEDGSWYMCYYSDVEVTCSACNFKNSPNAALSFLS